MYWRPFEVVRVSATIRAIALVAYCLSPAAQSIEQEAISSAALRSHVEALGVPDMLGRDTPGPGGDLAATYVAEQFKTAGLEPPRTDEADGGPVDAEMGGGNESSFLRPFTYDDRNVYNVVGVLRGGDPEEGTVVVGAHYDGVGVHGANFMPLSDDNASGTAILIVAATALADRVAVEGPLPHTVVFVAFGSEEDGLRGARHYCEVPPISLEGTRAMFNLDTVGRPRSGRLEIVGWSRYRALSMLVAHAAEKEGIEPVAGPRSLWQRSDQAVFSEAGVPAVWLLGHLRDDIHSPRDIPDRLDYEWMTQVARALVAVVQAGFSSSTGGGDS
jgi:Zn-dependent M28 family amino/carboxypeptidase